MKLRILLVSFFLLVTGSLEADDHCNFSFGHFKLDIFLGFFVASLIPSVVCYFFLRAIPRYSQNGITWALQHSLNITIISIVLVHMFFYFISFTFGLPVCMYHELTK